MYGISQNPDTKDYIMVLRYEHCEKCDEKYTYDYTCMSCLKNYLKKNFTNWTSGNEQIDEFIQKRQLKIDNPWMDTIQSVWLY